MPDPDARPATVCEDLDAALDALSSRGWLSEQPKDFRARIAACSRIAPYSEGEAVFHQGDPAGGVYGVISGGVSVLVGTDRHPPALVHICRSGDWFGLGPFVRAGRRRAQTFVASEPTVLLHVPLFALRDGGRFSPADMGRFSALVSRNSDVATHALCDLLINRADRRIAAVLLRVTGYRTAKDQGAPPSFYITQAQLGEMANVSRDYINRTLASFRRKGWIGGGYHRISVLDPAALEDLAFGGE